MKRAAVLLALLALAGCATPAEWIDMPDYRPARIEITERADLNIACRRDPDWNGNACTYRNPHDAVIYVRAGIGPAEYKRVMTHEIVMHVIEGKNHDESVRYRLEGAPR